MFFHPLFWNGLCLSYPVFFPFIKLYIYLNTRSTSENKSTLRLSSIRIVWQHVLWCTGWPKTERQNLYHCSRIKKHRLTAAQPCRYCFYSVVKNRFFRANRIPCQISRLSGQKCGNTAPKTVKISNFGHKFAPQGHSFAQFLRYSHILYASIGSFYVFNLVAFRGQTTKL